MTAPGGGWESLDPWEKAAQWKSVAPEITDELIRLARAKAIQDRRDQAQRAREQASREKFGRDMAEQAACRAHDLELERTRLERSRAERSYELEKERLAMRKVLQGRLWWLQLISIVGGLLAIGGMIIVGLMLGQSGEMGAASVAVFGVGGTLTASLLGAAVGVGRKLQVILRSESEGHAVREISSEGDRSAASANDAR